MKEKLRKRVSGAERAGIGCLLGTTGSQALQSLAAEFLSAFPLSLSFYLFKPDVNVAGVNTSSIQLAEKSGSLLGLGLTTAPLPVLCE